MNTFSWKQQLNDDLSEERWREGILRSAAVSMMLGIFLIVGFLVVTMQWGALDEMLIGNLLGIFACLGTLLWLRWGKRQGAVWFFLLAGWFAITILGMQMGNPEATIVIAATIVAIVLISITGRPSQTIISAVLSISANLTMTFLMMQGILPTTLDVTWSQSLATVTIYTAILVPIIFTSWVINSVIERLRNSNRKLLAEIEKRQQIELDVKRAETELRRQNNWFRNVIDNTLDIFVVYDETGILLDINRKGCDVLGYTRDEAIGRSILELDVDWSSERMSQQAVMMPVGSMALLKGRIRRHDGTVFPVEISAAVLQDGNVMRYVGFLRDITERLANEAIIKQSEEKFRSIYNSTPIGMYIVDTNGILVEVNDRWLEIIGYKREEMLGRKSIEFLTPELHKQAIEVDFPLFLKRGYTKNLPYQMVKKNGEIIDVLLSSMMRRDADGNFSDILTSILDVTEMNRMQAAVTENETRFRAIFNNAPTPGYLTNGQFKLTAVNAAFIDVLGYEPEEVIGCRTVEILYPEQEEWITNVVVPRFAEEGFINGIEVKAVHRDGRLIDLLLSASAEYDENGDMSGAIVTLTDVTEINNMRLVVQASEVKYRRVYNNVPVGIYSINNQGCIVEANDHWLQMLGYERSELIGRQSVELLTPESRQYAIEIGFPEFFKQGFVKDVPYQFVKKNGAVMNTLLSATMQFDADGRPLNSLATVADVTERLKLEAAIGQSEERFRNLYNLSPIMMHTVDATGTLNNVNDYWLSVMGCEREDVVGHSVAKFFTEESMKRAIEVDVPAYFSIGYANDLSYQMVKQNGDVIDVSFSARNQYDAEGNFSHTLATIKDVTAEKRLVKLVRESEYRFRQLYTETPVMMHAVNAKGFIYDVSNYWLIKTGYTRDDVIGRKSFTFYPEEDRETASEEWIPTLKKQGVLKNVPIRVIKSDGSLLEGILSSSSIKNETGQHVSALTTIIDVTERNRMEHQIKQSEQKFRTLFNDSSNFTAALSREGKILDVNDRVMTVSSIDREEMIGIYIWQVGVFAHLPKIQNNFKSMLYEIHQGAVNARRELSVILSTVGELTVDVIVTPIPDRNGDIDMMIMEARDITQLAQTREQLRQSAEDQGVLLREVHHRVKNNLQVITSMLRLQERSSDIAPKMLNSFREIRNRVQSMALIHEQLYQRTSNLDEIDLDIYMHDLMKEISRTYRRDVHVWVDVSDVRLDIDRALTCGLIVNELATNAMKYAFPDGKGKIEVRGHRDNGTVMLSVADDGVGLPETMIFPDTGSTGFQLIELMAQRLAAELTIHRDSGTQFYLKFPYRNV